MALKKSDLYSSLWRCCDELRGGMDAGQYKDDTLTLLLVKYGSGKAKADPNSMIDVPAGGYTGNGVHCEVEILERRLDKACDIKQGMLQQLRPGRTRLPVPEQSG